MSIQPSSGQETGAQTTQTTLDTCDEPMSGLSIGTIDESGAETGVDRRVERALTECFHARPTSSTEYLVDSGSGARYFTDLYDPDQPECSCEDDARYCKHVWYIFLFENPAFLTDRIFGLGTGR